MSECRRVTDRLTAYVDDLLQPEERGDVDRHLAECPGCRDLAGAERSAQIILRRSADHLLTEPLPPGLRSRCEAMAAARSAAGLRALGPWWRVRLIPSLLTVVVLVFTASAILAVVTRRSDGVLAAQLTADHSKCFKLFGPPSGAGADARSVERLLAEQYGWMVHVPSSSDDHGIELLGARRCLYGDGVIPHVMYRVHGQDVSLFVLPDTARNAADLVTFGHRSRVWTRGTSTFVLVSSQAAPDMASAVRYVIEEAR
jgi:anti-sigma factor RsiW